jgi:tetratricopeptide (TPR) repeat protein
VGSILFIDDAHLLDRSSVNLLARLAESLTIVLAYRSDEPASNRKLEPALQPLRRKGLLAELQITTLQPKAIRRLIRRFAGRELRSVAESITGQTQGNPLFVLASLQHLFEEGILYIDAAGCWAISGDLSLTLPPTTRHAIAGRLSKLSQAQRRVFDLASIMAEEFDFQLLQAVSDLEEDALLDVVDALLEMGLLVEPRALDRRELALAHGLYGEVAYQTLPKIRQRRMHGRIAGALLDISDDRDADAPALAHHFVEAGDRIQAAEWFVQAGDGALARYAHEEALAYYQQALKLRSDKSGPVWSRMGLVARHLARYEDGTSYYSRALVNWEQAGDQLEQIRCHFSLAECYRELSDFQRAAGQAQQGLDMAIQLEDHPDLVARGHIILSNALRSGQLAPTSEVRQCLLQALDLAQPAQAWQLVGEANFWLGVVAINQGDSALALRYDRQAIDFFQRTRQAGWQAITYNNVAYHALLDGQPLLAHEQAELGLNLARQIGSLHTQGWLLSTLGEIQRYLDHLEEAQIALEEGLALVNRWGPVRLKPGLLADLARVAMARKAWDTAVAQLEAALDLAQGTAPQFLPRLQLYLGQAYLGLGRQVDALVAAGQALEMAEDKSQHSVAGQARRLQARIQAGAGLKAFAMEAFADSLERLLTIDDTLEGARTQAAWGNWLASLGDPAADGLLLTAQSVFEGAGARLYLRQMAEGAAVPPATVQVSSQAG